MGNVHVKSCVRWGKRRGSPACACESVQRTLSVQCHDAFSQISFFSAPKEDAFLGLVLLFFCPPPSPARTFVVLLDFLLLSVGELLLLDGGFRGHVA